MPSQPVFEQELLDVGTASERRPFADEIRGELESSCQLDRLGVAARSRRLSARSLTSSDSPLANSSMRISGIVRIPADFTRHVIAGDAEAAAHRAWR